MALFYFVLGDGAERLAAANLGHYYEWLGEYTQTVIDSAAKDADTVKRYLTALEEAGADEVMCFPASHDPGQVGALAAAVGL